MKFSIGFVVWFCCWLYFMVTEANANPVGHLEPLGSHAHPQHVDTHYSEPTPEEFFKSYALPGVPVIFKRAAKYFPCYRRWTDDYLRKYGKWKVLIEDGKKEDREKPSYFMSLNEFLDGYKGNDTYLVHDVVPPNPMTEEISIPRSLQCGGFQNNIQSTVMWFSSGGTKSTLHSEGVDNFECMLDGWKEYLLISKKDGEQILGEHGDRYQEMDVDRVDLNRFPEIATIPWYKMHVEPGDCYFVPHGWYHFVNSSNTRNLAISFWLTHLYRFDQADCARPENYRTVLSKVKMGDARESSRVAFLDLFIGKESMSREVFLKFFGFDQTGKNEKKTAENDDPSLLKTRSAKTQEWLREHKTKYSETIFAEMDKDGDSLLTIDEVYATPLAVFEKLIGSLGEEYFGYETVEEGRSGEEVLKERKRLFLRNEL